ncbi:MAG: site-specific DNA-methyltransferase [Eubacteriales bacterium]|nr:site-specific DNA-methyltransferase [Eubacteriales bacterium]
MQITDKFEIVAVAEIKPDEHNARKHSDEQIKELRLSLREFGFVNPLLIDKEKKVIAGHGRLTAAIAEGMTAVPCIFVEHLTEAQRRAYMLADNRLAEHAMWDMDLLSEELKFLDDIGFDVTLTGFEMPDETEAVDDGYEPELPTEPKSKAGQVYRLGRHRLMCGDSTKPEDVALLMDGAQADLLLTDPPYNVDYKGKTQDELTIENDAQSDDAFLTFLVQAFRNAQEHMKPGAVFYIWHADSNGYLFRAAAREAGLTVHQCLIWVKNAMVMGRQDYQWKHEPCLYGWKEGAGHLWASDRKQTTVLEFDRPTRSKEHPTMKPIPLFDYQMQNNTKGGDIVLDLFGGSGTSVIAAEQNKRVCYCMEKDPRYADVIIDRWEKFTGETAGLL